MKETFIIIGEGPTEYFFLNSLKDEFRSMQNISPQYPKHTSMAELELIIKNAIEQGYENNDVAQEGGLLNCTTWTIYEEMPSYK